MMAASDLPGSVLGRSRNSAYRWAGFGIGLFSLVTAGLLLFHLVSFGREAALERTLFAVFWGAIFGVSLFAAAASAYRNGGWIVSVGLMFVPALSIGLLSIAEPFLRLPTPPRLYEVIVRPAPTLLLGAILVGTGAFAAGAGIRRIERTMNVR